MTVGERIKEVRTRLNMSQVSFADKINVSKQTLYKYENNLITNIPSDKIEAVAKIGNVSPGYLMGWTDTEKTIPSKYESFDDINYLKELGKLCDYEISTKASRYFGTELIIKKSGEEHQIRFMNHEIQKILSDLEKVQLQILTTAVDKKYSNKDYYEHTENLNRIFGTKIETIDDARAYLSLKKEHIAAFGGDKELPDDAIINIANVLLEHENKGEPID